MFAFCILNWLNVGLIDLVQNDHPLRSKSLNRIMSHKQNSLLTFKEVKYFAYIPFQTKCKTVLSRRFIMLTLR